VARSRIPTAAARVQSQGSSGGTMLVQTAYLYTSGTDQIENTASLLLCTGRCLATVVLSGSTILALSKPVTILSYRLLLGLPSCSYSRTPIILNLIGTSVSFVCVGGVRPHYWQPRRMPHTLNKTATSNA
jgi:hypothetical protein